MVGIHYPMFADRGHHKRMNAIHYSFCNSISNNIYIIIIDKSNNACTGTGLNPPIIILKNLDKYTCNALEVGSALQS